MGTVFWVLQLTDDRGHHIRQSKTDKECVEPYFHRSSVFVRWCLDMLTAAMQAGVVEKHISLLVCATPNDADSS
jgi:hypothetical protein